jgi:hypothetical protein
VPMAKPATEPHVRSQEGGAAIDSSAGEGVAAMLLEKEPAPSP